eukprot:m.131006 g.131006  ORF g.131006 m.131006 type:complete len:84 (-) comp13065_c6_seq1:52-303(-)
MLGKGAFTGEGRCYMFWQDFVKCIEKNGNEKKVCVPFREDYDECLHLKKLNARRAKIQEEMDRQKKLGTLPAEVTELLGRDKF